MLADAIKYIRWTSTFLVYDLLVYRQGDDSTPKNAMRRIARLRADNLNLCHGLQCDLVVYLITNKVDTEPKSTIGICM